MSIDGEWVVGRVINKGQVLTGKTCERSMGMVVGAEVGWMVVEVVRMLIWTA